MKKIKKKTASDDNFVSRFLSKLKHWLVEEETKKDDKIK